MYKNNWIWRLLTACSLSVVVLMARAPIASAHPVDEYLQAAYLSIETDRVTIELNLLPGALVAPDIIKLIDADGDGVFSDNESQAYASRVMRELRVTRDGQSLTLQPIRVQLPDRVLMQAGGGEVHLAYTSAFLPTTGEHILIFENAHVPVKSAYQAALLISSTNTIQTHAQQHSDDSKALTVTYSINDTNSNSSTANTTGTLLPQPDTLLALLRQRELTLSMLLLAMLTAFVLGGLHALTPGHGKTLAAAYLVGSRGNARHALWLGLTVTATHTVSVIVIGGLALLASQFALPNVFLPALEIASGLLVTVLGARLLWTRLKARNDHHHEHGHNHAHDHEHTHDHVFGAHSHIHDANSITRGGMLAMGISGGLVPCPEALGIMLVAIGIGRIVLGLGLILMFSAGLATVLVALGMMVIKARPLFERYATSDSAWQRLLPVASACVVTVLGVAMLAKGLSLL